MPLLINELFLGDLNTISIPIDAILIVSLLSVFGCIGYFFNTILENQTNELTKEIDNYANLELVKDKSEDELRLEVNKVNRKNIMRPTIRKLNILTPSKLIKLVSVGLIVIGGANLIELKSMQKSYEGLNTSKANIKLDNKSDKSLLAIFKIKSFDKTQTKIKKISYIDPFLLTINGTKYNHYYKLRKKQIDNNFSF
tara:strand:+ start:310 stop:900 length:591 start_codon:yes stop_codon:yes gene_type:complete